jgi:hypothetical protein
MKPTTLAKPTMGIALLGVKLHTEERQILVDGFYAFNGNNNIIPVYVYITS